MPASGLTVRDVAEALVCTERAVQARAAREKWPKKAIPGRGRGGKRYVFQSGFMEILNEGERISILQWLQNKEAQPLIKRSCSQVLCEAQEKKKNAKADLLRLYLARMKTAKWGNKKKVRRDFMRAYNSGIAYPKLFEIIGEVSWKTIDGWKRAVRDQGDTAALADRRGYGMRGQRCVNPEQAGVLLSLVQSPHNNKKLKSEIIRIAKSLMIERGIEDGLSDATYRRWLDDWISVNWDDWNFWREGKRGVVNNCAFYVERDYDLIGVGDMIVADGHTLNFNILNPWTGKPKRMTLILWYDMKSNYPLGWEIMPTENTQAIASALRRAIMRLGKYPTIAYMDNGKAFAAKYFNGKNLEEEGFSGLYQRLGIHTIFTWPYHPQSKPIERFFRTFAELERIPSSHTGTSIEHKPPHMHMGEKLLRKMHNKMTGGTCPTLEQAHRAIASWFDMYALRPQKDSHLNGKCPQEVFEAGKGPGVNELELRFLMMSEDIRTIRRRGIRYFGKTWFYSPKLYGRKHAVKIRYDWQRQDSILVYDLGGEYICEAERVGKVHPAASLLGTDADREELARQLEMKNSQIKGTMSSARAFVESDMVPEIQQQMSAAGRELEQTLQAEGAKVKQLPAKLTEADEKRILAEVAETRRATSEGRLYLDSNYTFEEKETPEIWQQLPGLPDNERYKKLCELEVRSFLIPKTEAAWMRYYELTDEYKLYEDVFEEHRVKVMLSWQMEEQNGRN